MFASDAQGDASLEAVQMMSKMIKENSNDVIHPDALNMWQYVAITTATA